MSYGFLYWLVFVSLIIPGYAQEARIHWNFEKIEQTKTKQTLNGNFNPEMSPPVALVVSGKTQEVMG